MKHKSILLFVAGILIFSSSTFAQYNPEITTTDLQKQIGFLASDSLKGRKPGTPEDGVASAYIRDCFSKAGLKLLFDNGFQKFEIVSDVNPGENNSISFDGYTATPNVDFTPLSFSASAVLAPTVAVFIAVFAALAA
jgi:hypothetical protein